MSMDIFLVLELSGTGTPWPRSSRSSVGTCEWYCLKIY